MDPTIKKYIDDKFDGLNRLFLEHMHQGPSVDQTKQIPNKRVSLKDAATIDTNAILGNHFFCTLTGNRTLNNPTQARDGQHLVFELIQDSTGSRTITLGSKFVAGAYTITLTTTASKRDFIECIYSAEADKFYIILFSKNY